jgi:hypothetical protein
MMTSTPPYVTGESPVWKAQAEILVAPPGATQRFRMSF